MPKDLPISGANGKTRVITAESIAKRRYYFQEERDNDAAEWLRRQLDVAPTAKLAAEVFGTTVARVTKARRLLDRRDRLHAGGHRDAGDHHHHHNHNGKPVPTPTDREADRLVEWLGAARVLAALDRATEPELPLRAAE
jgi:hypothetical protein